MAIAKTTSAPTSDQWNSFLVAINQTNELLNAILIQLKKENLQWIAQTGNEISDTDITDKESTT